MAQLHAFTGQLPEDRTQLYTEAVQFLNNDWNKAGVFIDYIRERAGLLIRHKTEAYTFPHRTFQEFLRRVFQ